MMRVWTCVVVATVFAAGPALAQSAGDLVVYPAVPGYVAAPAVKNGDVTVVSLFPAGQSADNWSETLTVTSYNKQTFVPSDFEATQVREWMPSCTKTVVTQQLVNDNENGFPAATWQVSCANNPATGKPEIAWFKAIQGTTVFYLTGRTFRYTVMGDLQAQVLQFMKLVLVCDVKSAEHRCPPTSDYTPPPPAMVQSPATTPAASAPAAPPVAKPQ